MVPALSFRPREKVCKLTIASVAPRFRYDVALLYLKQVDYDLDLAIEAFKEDERWEKEHPLEATKGKGKANQVSYRKRRGMGLSMTGQIT